MSDDVKCPYCGKYQEINHDDGYGYKEDELHQQQCGNCDKYFVFTTSISFYYEAEKADCLNDDGEHDFHPTSTYPKCCTRLRCSMCDEEKELPRDHEIIKNCDCSCCERKRSHTNREG